jgi:hypothetical protein
MKPWSAWLPWLAFAGLSLDVTTWSTAAEPPPEGVPGADAAAGGDREAGMLKVVEAANGNRGPRKLYADPITAAAVFLAALEKKDLNRLAQATALRAATESKNQELFYLILAQRLGRNDLNELAEQLSGYKLTGTITVARNTVRILVTKPAGNGVLRRTLTMREEKAGWKLLDISGEGELAKPIYVPRKDRGGNRL